MTATTVDRVGGFTGTLTRLRLLNDLLLWGSFKAC